MTKGLVHLDTLAKEPWVIKAAEIRERIAQKAAQRAEKNSASPEAVAALDRQSVGATAS